MQKHCCPTNPIRRRTSTKTILLFNGIDAIGKQAMKIEEEGRDRNGASANPSATTHCIQSNDNEEDCFVDLKQWIWSTWCSFGESKRVLPIFYQVGAKHV